MEKFKQALRTCLNFAQVRFEDFIRVCFLVFMSMIADYHNKKQIERKLKEDMVEFPTLENLGP